MWGNAYSKSQDDWDRPCIKRSRMTVKGGQERRSCLMPTLQAHSWVNLRKSTYGNSASGYWFPLEVFMSWKSFLYSLWYTYSKGQPLAGTKGWMNILEQWLSACHDFHPTPPPGSTGQRLETFWLLQARGGANTLQCTTSTRKNYSNANVSSARLEPHYQTGGPTSSPAPWGELGNATCRVPDESCSDESSRGPQPGRCGRISSGADRPVGSQSRWTVGNCFVQFLKVLFSPCQICKKSDENIFGLTKYKINIVLTHLRTMAIN